MRERAARELAIAVALGAVGALGALPVGARGADPLAMLTWIALIAPAAGFCAGALGLALFPYALVAPAAWMGALALVDAASARDLPTPLYSGLAWSGLFAAALGLGRRAREPWLGTAALLALAALLTALPGKGVLAREPWPSAFASRALDLSPAAFVCETAGVHDWMWQRGNYDDVGVDRFQRSPWRGELAGPVALVVGCILALTAGRRSKAAVAASPAE